MKEEILSLFILFISLTSLICQTREIASLNLFSTSPCILLMQTSYNSSIDVRVNHNCRYNYSLSQFTFGIPI